MSVFSLWLLAYAKAVRKMLKNFFFLILFMALQKLTILTRLALPLVVIFFLFSSVIIIYMRMFHMITLI